MSKLGPDIVHEIENRDDPSHVAPLLVDELAPDAHEHEYEDLENDDDDDDNGTNLPIDEYAEMIKNAIHEASMDKDDKYDREADDDNDDDDDEKDEREGKKDIDPSKKMKKEIMDNGDNDDDEDHEENKLPKKQQVSMGPKLELTWANIMDINCGWALEHYSDNILCASSSASKSLKRIVEANLEWHRQKEKCLMQFQTLNALVCTLKSQDGTSDNVAEPVAAEYIRETWSQFPESIRAWATIPPLSIPSSTVTDIDDDDGVVPLPLHHHHKKRTPIIDHVTCEQIRDRLRVRTIQRRYISFLCTLEQYILISSSKALYHKYAIHATVAKTGKRFMNRIAKAQMKIDGADYLPLRIDELYDDRNKKSTSIVGAIATSSYRIQGQTFKKALGTAKNLCTLLSKSEKDKLVYMILVDVNDSKVPPIEKSEKKMVSEVDDRSVAFLCDITLQLYSLLSESVRANDSYDKKHKTKETMNEIKVEKPGEISSRR